MGGELGWIVKGQTVPEFEKAAFTLQPGQTSGLIKTVYGYHILQIEQHEQARLQPFEEVKGQLTADYMQQYTNDQMQKMADQAESALRRDPGHPDKVAAAVGGEYLEADKIRSFDPLPGGIGVNKDFNQAIIGLKKGEATSSPILITGNKVVLAAVLEVNQAHASSFEEAKVEAKGRAQTERVSKIVTDKTRALVEKAKANGGDLEKAGKELGIEVKTSADVDRQGAFEGVGQASTLPDALTKPVGEIFGPDPIAAGAYVVGKVIAKTPGDAAALAAQMASIRNDLRQQKTQDRATVFEDGLKKRLESEGKLKIHQDVISRIVQNYSGKS
jgi:peptidyl-prolyl cis-trans isomerase D